MVVGERDAADTEAMLEMLHRRFLPRTVLALRTDGREGQAIAALAPFVSEQHTIDGRATAYVCVNHACSNP